MSADFHTFITVSGTQDELLAVLKVLRFYERDLAERYRSSRDCAYIELVNVKEGIDTSYFSGKELDSLTEEDIVALAAEMDGAMSVRASGPYGIFSLVEEVPLFQDIAEAAPGAVFTGEISGFSDEVNQEAKGELKEGLLNLYYSYHSNEGDWKARIEKIAELLPYDEFIERFKLDEDEFEEDFYAGLIGDYDFPNLGYKEFMDYCECSKITEAEYDQEIEKIRQLLEPEQETEEIEVEPDSIYDPVNKEYIRRGGFYA